MNVAIGNDSKGFLMKKHLVEVLRAHGYQVEDLGCHSLEKVDYPDYARLVCEGVLAGKYACGVLICGTGVGMSIAANKFKGIRAALCYETFPAIMSREHNDANVFCTGGWIITPEKAAEVLLHWLGMRYAGGRHQENLDKVAAIEATCGD